MKQLTATDSQMLFVETQDKPNHIAPLIIYDPSSAPGGIVTHKSILAHIESRLHLAPGFRRKLMRVPLDLDEPYWVDDTNFDLEYHVRHLALPQPGDWRQLCIQVARLVSRPLDPGRPLWEFNIIEGLDNVEGLPPGSFAVLMKIHHSMMDGKAGAELISALHDFAPKAAEEHRDAELDEWQPKKLPSRFKLATTGMRRMVFKPGHAFRVVTKAMPNMIKFSGTRKSRSKLRVPNTPLNGRITGPRVFDARFFALDEFKEIRSLVPGATVNDVALAVISGAMRRYLGAKGQLPGESLVASVPISVRSEGSAQASEGNELIGQNVLLKTDIEDPVQRLQALCEVMGETKAYVNAVGAKQLSELFEAVPGSMMGLLARAMSTVAETSGQTIVANTVVTNVPGVPVPLYMNGAKAVKMCGCGPLAFTMGTIHIVGSYCGQICVNITAARDLLPDPDFYAECIEESFKEYRALVAAAASGKKPTKKKPTKQKAAARKKLPARNKTAPA